MTSAAQVGSQGLLKLPVSSKKPERRHTSAEVVLLRLEGIISQGQLTQRSRCAEYQGRRVLQDIPCCGRLWLASSVRKMPALRAVASSASLQRSQSLRMTFSRPSTIPNAPPLHEMVASGFLDRLRQARPFQHHLGPTSLRPCEVSAEMKLPASIWIDFVVCFFSCRLKSKWTSALFDMSPRSLET